VRPDGLGYVLEGEWIDGFAGPTELPIPTRRLVAELAEWYAPGTLTGAQAELRVRSRNPTLGSASLRWRRMGRRRRCPGGWVVRALSEEE